jgi:nicotinamide riboside transporter PnuC
MSTTLGVKMIIATVFEWIGTCSGILGAAMIASKAKISPFGWIAFLISSCSLSVFAFLTGAFGLLTLELVFVLTNIAGLWNWLLKPYIKRTRCLQEGNSNVLEHN